MSAPVDIGTLITRSPEIKRGAPRIAGTGVTVRTIVNWYKQGLTPEEIAFEAGPLTLAQVHAALTYYHSNKDEIERDLREQELEYDRLAKEFPRRELPA